MAYAFALPVLPGKATAVRQFVREVLGSRKADWDDLQRRQGGPKSVTSCRPRRRATS